MPRQQDRDSPPACRVMAALTAGPGAMRLTGQVVDVGEMADRYGIDDLDGTPLPCRIQGCRPWTPSLATK